VARPTPATLALPARPAAEVCQFGIPIRILEPNPTGGNVSLFELIVLDHLIAQRAPQVVFELGTFDGRTTINFAANTPPYTLVYTIDLPQRNINETKLDITVADRKYIDKGASGARFADTLESTKITQLFGDTAAFDFSNWNGQVDFVFIDASHSASYVRNDTEVALRLIGNRGGLITWHDYNGSWPGLTEVIDEFRRNDPRLKNLAYVAGTSIAFCEILG
jgi:predicted O-methyltransferase YrrM